MLLFLSVFLVLSVSSTCTMHCLPASSTCTLFVVILSTTCILHICDLLVSDVLCTWSAIFLVVFYDNIFMC